MLGYFYFIIVPLSILAINAASLFLSISFKDVDAGIFSCLTSLFIYPSVLFSNFGAYTFIYSERVEFPVSPVVVLPAILF